ncbi:MAG: EAL domain-containing protein [Pleurocapsa sp.]
MSVRNTVCNLNHSIEEFCMSKPIASLSSQTILIVDDTPNILQLLFNYLNNVGYKILIAQNGKKALKVAEAMQPDLIILDVMMPELDGFATCRYLKTNSSTKDIPIIFMTALAQPEEKVQGLMLGAVDYITKPIEEQELLARIQTHLSLQSLHQHLAKDIARQNLLYEISDRIRRSLDLDLIFKTATNEIRSFLNCDLVTLAQIKEQDIEIRSCSSLEKITPETKQTISHSSLCSSRQEYQSYLQGNVRIYQQQESSVCDRSTDILKSKARLIVPILIGHIDLPLSSSTSILTKDDATNRNSLYGWLIAERYQSPQQWQPEEISFLKELTTQLAIAIIQGQLHQKISQLAVVDSLTKVYNRRYFDQQLNLEWRRLKRISAPLSLIMCDVDYFKIYNDTYGHQQGDRCLQLIAKAISKVLKRSGDVLSRYGGEEFVVILPHTHLAGATQVAEAIKETVKELKLPHVNSLADSVVTVSMGVASTVPSSEDSPHLLIEASDLALYQAKERGRDCLAVYSEAISHSKEIQEFKFQWVKRIRKALKNNLFSLYAQSITPLDSNDSTKHFEILLRLTDEEQVILPHVFLAIAERNFLMTDIDTWVVNTLFDQLAHQCPLENQSLPNNLCWNNYRFSVNLSGAALNSKSFRQFLRQKLIQSPFPAYIFCFEITETIAVQDLAQAVKFINSLKQLGCSFALDDFGKGMSSLTYLQNLPVDYLKIDGSFIRELYNDNKASKVMVEAINHIAEGIGLKTVAEFVENQNILDTVKELQVNYAQGFHLGRPGLLMDVISSQILVNY